MKRLLTGAILAGAAGVLFVVGKVAYAASSNPEFSDVLNMVVDSWAELLDFAYKVIELTLGM